MIVEIGKGVRQGPLCGFLPRRLQADSDPLSDWGRDRKVDSRSGGAPVWLVKVVSISRSEAKANVTPVHWSWPDWAVSTRAVGCYRGPGPSLARCLLLNHEHDRARSHFSGRPALAKSATSPSMIEGSL